MNLKTPISETDVRNLNIGDVIEITGTLVIGRDMAHKHMIDKNQDLPFDLKGGVIYHCGPVVAKKGSAWEMISCGPTTSIRQEPYEEEVINRYGIKAVIGKGGMGDKTLKALKKQGCVYLAATGGAGAILAKKVVKIKEVYMLKEFGIPEAFWILEVNRFGPLIVAMDSHGKSIYKDVEETSQIKLNEILNEL